MNINLIDVRKNPAGEIVQVCLEIVEATDIQKLKSLDTDITDTHKFHVTVNPGASPVGFDVGHVRAVSADSEIDCGDIDISSISSLVSFMAKLRKTLQLVNRNRSDK